jgi:hypothetical protein
MKAIRAALLLLKGPRNGLKRYTDDDDYMHDIV